MRVLFARSASKLTRVLKSYGNNRSSDAGSNMSRADFCSTIAACEPVKFDLQFCSCANAPVVMQPSIIRLGRSSTATNFAIMAFKTLHGFPFKFRLAGLAMGRCTNQAI